MTLAIAHAEGERAVLDLVRERRPRFNPDDVCTEFANVLRDYGLASVVGDQYAKAWVPERFAAHGVTYTYAGVYKSEIYLNLVPAVNRGVVELLDLPRLRTQLQGLERRVARGGKDSIEHAAGGHDDVANAAAGALVLALQGGGMPMTEEVFEPGPDGWQGFVY